jgi:hypothetical protein
MKSLLVLFFSLFITGHSFAQVDHDPKLFTDTIEISDNIDYFILGEDHSKDNTKHKLEVIKQLYNSSNLRNVLIEIPRSFEIYVNDYITTGNKNSFQVIKRGSFMNKRDALNFFKEVYVFNKTLPQSDQLKLTCFDINSIRGKNSLKGIETMLSYWDDNELDQLKKLVSQKSKYLPLIQSNIELINSELEKNEAVYKTVLKEYFYVLKDALEGASVINFNGKASINNDALLVKREEYIAKILFEYNKQDNLGLKLVFAGQAHASNLEYDTLLEATSFNYILRNKYELNTISCFTVYFNNRESFFDKFYAQYIDYLKLDLDSIYTSTKSQYIYIEKDLFVESPFFVKRCDAILVKNCYRKKK